MSDARPEPGSYRDPAGRIFHLDGRVLRTVMPSATADFEQVRASGLIDSLVADGFLLGEKVVDCRELGDVAKDASFVLEHPRLSFVSYPYEWPFPALKKAALLQLDIYLRALELDVTLSDASAYNIQFQGARAVFIDHLSFKPYTPGDFWRGHRQFCEQFLNPLLLRSSLGIAHNAWYRGALEGISTTELARLMPTRKKLGWNVLTHVVLQAYFQKKSASASKAKTAETKRQLPKQSFENMLRGLHAWISKLYPADTGKTVWQDYDQEHSYQGDEYQTKMDFVTEFVEATKPAMLWDIGCNTGDFSAAALEAGAELVVGLDSDQGALEKAFARATDRDLNLLPLHMNLANPSPDQGWEQLERAGLQGRAKADAIIALAVIHHLAISSNIPLARAVQWLVALAPNGVIEFVPKNDPMVQKLLALREDIFADYSEQTFTDALEASARIVKRQTVSATGREMFWYSRD